MKGASKRCRAFASRFLENGLRLASDDARRKFFLVLCKTENERCIFEVLRAFHAARHGKKSALDVARHVRAACSPNTYRALAGIAARRVSHYKGRYTIRFADDAKTFPIRRSVGAAATDLLRELYARHGVDALRRLAEKSGTAVRRLEKTEVRRLRVRLFSIFALTTSFVLHRPSLRIEFSSSVPKVPSISIRRSIAKLRCGIEIILRIAFA